MERTVSIALSGEVMLGRLVDRTMRRHGAAYPWGDIAGDSPPAATAARAEGD